MSVRYVEPAVRLHPDIETLRSGERGDDFGLEPTPADLEEAQVFEAMISFDSSSRILKCGLCAQAAVFMIPDGLRCDEHAWQAAAMLDWDSADPWVPIRIDRSNA